MQTQISSTGQQERDGPTLARVGTGANHPSVELDTDSCNRVRRIRTSRRFGHPERYSCRYAPRVGVKVARTSFDIVTHRDIEPDAVAGLRGPEARPSERTAKPTGVDGTERDAKFHHATVRT